jgi:hypothetical protein
MRRLLASGTLAAALVLCVGCSAVQKSQVCPGSSCGSALKSVFDQVGREPGVTTVHDVRRDYGLDDGTSGAISVTASVTEPGAAKTLALSLVQIYRSGKVDPVDRIDVDITPEKPSTVPGRMAGTSYSRPAETADCSATRCRSQAGDFTDAWPSSPAADDLDLRTVTWGTDDQARPVFTLRLTASGDRSPRDISTLSNTAAQFADTSGLTKYGAVRTVIAYHRITHFAYSYDVAERRLQRAAE